jgi:hypothetical protein
VAEKSGVEAGEGFLDGGAFAEAGLGKTALGGEMGKASGATEITEMKRGFGRHGRAI